MKEQLQNADNAFYQEICDNLPAAIYINHNSGEITYYNQAAARLWRRKPGAGEKWRGAFHSYADNGEVMSQDKSAIAVSMEQNQRLRGVEIAIERPDGTLVPCLPYFILHRQKWNKKRGKYGN